jgi:hypothetical protein
LAKLIIAELPPGQPIGIYCPSCRQLAAFTISDTQAFCDTPNCRMIMWDPTKTPEEMAAEGIHEVNLSDG